LQTRRPKEALVETHLTYLLWEAERPKTSAELRLADRRAGMLEASRPDALGPILRFLERLAATATGGRR
jgi:hypothetical protein